MIRCDFCPTLMMAGKTTLRKISFAVGILLIASFLLFYVTRISIYFNREPEPFKFKFAILNLESSTKLPMTSEEEFRRRRVKMEERCSSSQMVYKVGTRTKPQVLAHNKSGLLYCHVPKAGCSFWKFVMRGLNIHDKPTIQNTISVSLYDIHYSVKTLVDFDRRKFSSDKYPVRFLVARDPFSRLLSVYLDKLYLPDFWSTPIAKPVRGEQFNTNGSDFFQTHFQNMLREFPNSPKAPQDCGKHTTFAQFIQKMFSIDNEHWRTIQALCNPCAFNVTHIVTMKTFSNDARAILAHSSKGAHLLDNFHRDLQTTQDMELVANFQFHNLIRSHMPSGCATAPEVAQRLWNNFQWRGYIHPHISLDLNRLYSINGPLTRKNLDKVESEFYRQLRFARDEGLKKPELMKKAKEEFTEQAYKSLPTSAFFDILLRFEQDFELFGFEEETRKIRTIMLGFR